LSGRCGAKLKAISRGCRFFCQPTGHPLLFDFSVWQTFTGRRKSAAGVAGPRAVSVPNLMRETEPVPQQQFRAPERATSATTARHLTAIVHWSKRVIAQERPPYAELLPLFGRLYDEMQPASQTRAGWLLPVRGPSAAARVDPAAEYSDAEYFVEGLTAARLIVWTVHDAPRVAERLPKLVVAALLQDIGRHFAATILKRFKGKRDNRAEWLEHHHPSIGAALLGAVHRAPVELSLLVAQHHERLDGGGFPGALVAREMAADAAILAAATRFARLCLEIDRQPTSETEQKRRLVEIGQVFCAEAKWGMWSVEFANRLLQRIAAIEEIPELHTETIGARPVDRPTEPADGLSHEAATSDDRRELHSAESVMRGMHVGSDGQFAATTLEEIRRLANRPAREPG
jgi:hypothetical protein